MCVTICKYNYIVRGNGNRKWKKLKIPAHTHTCMYVLIERDGMKAIWLTAK